MFYLVFKSRIHCYPLQVDFTLTISAMWLKTARSVQMVPLLHMTKHQEHERKIARLVPMVKNYFIVEIYSRPLGYLFVNA